MGDVLSCLNSDESEQEQIEFSSAGNEQTEIERQQLVALKETFGSSFVKHLAEYRDENGRVNSLNTLLGIQGAKSGLLKSVDSHGVHRLGADASEIPDADLGCDPEYLRYLLRELNFGNFARPEASDYHCSHDGKSSFRIGSWNLKEFSNEKASNMGVKEVVCRTILENGINLLAAQELGDAEALQKICDELNDPVLPLVRDWAGPRGQWESIVSKKTGRMYRSNEYNGFLYDTSRNIENMSSYLLNCPSGEVKEFVRKPYIGVFKAGNFDFVVVSVHLKATGMKNEDLGRLKEEIDNIPTIFKAIEEDMPDEKDIIVLGDFNLTPESEDFNVLRDRGFTNAVPGDMKTNISMANPHGSHTYDNIWMSEQCQTVYTENMAVVRQGLCHPLIPDSWSWGGILSDHCPIWAEFYVDDDKDG